MEKGMNQLDTMIGLYKEGLTTREIGRQLNLGKTTVWNYFRKAGIDRSVKYERIIKLYEQGLSSLDIGKKLNITSGAVTIHLRKAGVVRSLSEAGKLAVKQGKRNLTGSANGNWKGGRYIEKDGYVKVKSYDHPRGQKSQHYVLEHILVWERVHKRFLPDGWVIHHINGVKTDNRPSNLLAVPTQNHDKLALLHEVQKRVRELEEDNRILQKALDDSQLIFRISEN
jgi:DNA-binding CsgD family transcriptional regulator